MSPLAAQVLLTAILGTVACVAMAYEWPIVVCVLVILIMAVLSTSTFSSGG